MKPLWVAPIVPYPQLKQVLQGSAEADAGRRWLAASWGRGCWAGQLGSPRSQGFPEGAESGTPGCGEVWQGPGAGVWGQALSPSTSVSRISSQDAKISPFSPPNSFTRGCHFMGGRIRC